MMTSSALKNMMLQNMTTKRAPLSRLFSSSCYLSAPGKLSGKVAIVTASTEGIGFGIAENLARHGASVMLSSRKVGRGC